LIQGNGKRKQKRGVGVAKGNEGAGNPVHAPCVTGKKGGKVSGFLEGRREAGKVFEILGNHSSLNQAFLGEKKPQPFTFASLCENPVRKNWGWLQTLSKKGRLVLGLLCLRGVQGRFRAQNSGERWSKGKKIPKKKDHVELLGEKVQEFVTREGSAEESSTEIKEVIDESTEIFIRDGQQDALLERGWNHRCKAALQRKWNLVRSKGTPTRSFVPSTYVFIENESRSASMGEPAKKLKRRSTSECS